MTSPANIDDVFTPPSTDLGPGWGQSLSNGALGPALLHLVTARARLGPPDPAHAWLRAATRAPVSSHIDGGLFCGATALAYVLHIASPTHPLLDALDEHIDTLARKRLDAAHARINQGELAETAEFDLIKGLTGIGTYLLTRTPGSRRTTDVLTYLVRLTQPIRHRGEELPGWWAHNAPISGGDFSGGHANLGLAHGISGPLALLSAAQIRGITVEGQDTAIARICSWMDHWHTTDTDGAAGWPRWITQTQHRNGTGAETNPMPLAWCYGTPGQARAQQLAAQALGEDERHVIAVRALAPCASNTAAIARLDGSLCHGRAGLLQTLRRAATDGGIHALTPHLTALEEQARGAACTGAGFLEGAAGNALALLPGTAQRIGWDACLLTTV
ncbi:lanthionine synthetase C family protein [Lipingzhangella sp. LS1_29]|uniref:Lanthionine synthetase C family protein n=1 Tax=Lipingzhangella rawalii TaxID=2055835 RepID=A0ABU2H3T7_9ACTN|nr:lanthionine synthetase C family protein [Lipingzhangella rawalii]MDS1269269.1 lanthionine synthetase C family protein [Lipingzhangella rawalii]